MAHGITGIDHAIVLASDLEQARETYRRLGFTLTPRGRHSGSPTDNYRVMFKHDYFE
ncbi:MAG: VOC family protein, partial [Sphingomonadales bacterium]